jgi:peptide/nickel transport system substrate-binding protein
LSGGSGKDTLDPHQGLTYLDTARAQSLYQPLIQLDSRARAEFVLAETITPNKTTSEWVIRLREGVAFHDGKPLTAQDVIYTFRRIKSQALPGANSLGPIDVAGLKALDRRTVLVPFTSPYGSFPDQLTYWYYLYIIPDGFDPATQKPNGTGPFTYQSFSPGQRSVFTRNPHYWKSGRPHVDSVTIVDFTDNISLQVALEGSIIDAAGAFDGQQFAAVAYRDGLHAVSAHTGAITPFTMRVDQPPFHDVRVRQALRLLVDRGQMVENALGGHGLRASDVFSPYDPDFDTSLQRIGFADVPQAQYLLKQAGHDNLTLRLTTSAVATGTVAMAVVLAAQAKEAGVTINLNQVDPTVFFGKGNGRDTGYLNWPFSQDFYNYSPYLAQVAQSMLPGSPFNETHTDNPSYTRLYREANQTLDAGLRREIVRDMQIYDFTQGGYIIPVFVDSIDAYSARLAGYSASAVGQPLSGFDFEAWWFPR